MRHINRFVAFFICALAVPYICSAQAQIKTRRVRMSDFTTKTTKVVLSGGGLLDATLSEEVTRRWRVSPYEFCTLDEYERQRTSTDYYFLLITEDVPQQTRGGGVLFLTLQKGGKEQDPDPKNVKMEVVSFPLGSVKNSSGKEFSLISAAVDIIQDYVQQAIVSDKVAYAGLTVYSGLQIKGTHKHVVFDKSDIISLNDKHLRRLDKGSVTITDEADSVFVEGKPGTLVAFVVAADSAIDKDYCYKMLIDAGTHELYWFKKQRIGKKCQAGFREADIKLITKGLR